MSWPNVTVNQLNQLQGETKDIERVVLFIGRGATNAGKTLAVNTQTDFDVQLGAADSVLKSQVCASARQNNRPADKIGATPHPPAGFAS